MQSQIWKRTDENGINLFIYYYFYSLLLHNVLSLSLSLSLSHGLTLSSHCQSCPRQLLPSLRRSHQPLSISPWGHASPNFADLAHNIITLSTLLVFWSYCFRSPTFRPSPPLDPLPSDPPPPSDLPPSAKCYCGSVLGGFFGCCCGIFFFLVVGCFLIGYGGLILVGFSGWGLIYGGNGVTIWWWWWSGSDNGGLWVVDFVFIYLFYIIGVFLKIILM